MLTTEQYTILSEPRFLMPLKQASRDYCTIKHKDLLEMLVLLYGANWRKAVHGDPLTCATCRIRVLKSIYALYREYEKLLEEQDGKLEQD